MPEISQWKNQYMRLLGLIRFKTLTLLNYAKSI